MIKTWECNEACYCCEEIEKATPQTLQIFYASDYDGVGGKLMFPGSATESFWVHYSSSMDWLKADLTTTFESRHSVLRHFYPHGWDLEMVEMTSEE